jgi:hypothetical protein
VSCAAMFFQRIPAFTAPSRAGDMRCPPLYKFLCVREGDDGLARRGITTPMNTGTNVSAFNTKKQSRQLLDAVAYSFCIGRPTNFFITLHFAKAGVEPGNYRRFLRVVFKRLGDWYRRNVGGAPIFIWQRENPTWFDQNENRCGGPNLHMLVHVPLELGETFRDCLNNWTIAAGGKIRSQALEGYHLFGAADFHELELAEGIVRTARYIVKGTDPAACAEMGIGNEDKREQGMIVGKRCGISQGLSSKKWDWPEIASERYPAITVAGSERRRRRMVAHAGYAMTGTPASWIGLAEG